MRSQEIFQVYKDVHSAATGLSTLAHPVTFASHTRPYSVSIGDIAFGDGGKGSVTDKFNTRLKDRKVTSMRANGGANAGHEVSIDGKQIVTHQLPVGVLREWVTPIMSRGMLIHPHDLIAEIEDVAAKFGGNLPAKPIIDGFTPLGLDTHRALEKAIKANSEGSSGSTGKAIAQGYASFYDRTAVFIENLVDKQWEKLFREHYRLYNKLLAGFGEMFLLENATVSSYEGERPVGDEDEFIYRLEQDRVVLKPYVANNMHDRLQKTWNDHTQAFTIEFGQGAGLDPYHGVYPDVTASRTTSRNLPDVSYGIIDPNDIAVRGAVFKTIYLSSVGIRKLPEVPDEETLNAIRDENREFGKTTGRERPPKHISIPLFTYLRRASGDNVLFATHLDAAREDRPIKVITHYVDKKTGNEKPYLPKQNYLNDLEARCVEFEGWDGNAVKEITDPGSLPDNAKRYLSFINQTVGPVVFGTTGPEVEDVISWLPKGY